MDLIEAIQETPKVFFLIPLLSAVLGATMREYTQAIGWYTSHAGVDSSYYPEIRKQKKKYASNTNKISYYIGVFGRKLAKRENRIVNE